MEIDDTSGLLPIHHRPARFSSEPFMDFTLVDGCCCAARLCKCDEICGCSKCKVQSSSEFLCFTTDVHGLCPGCCCWKNIERFPCCLPLEKPLYDDYCNIGCCCIAYGIKCPTTLCQSQSQQCCIANLCKFPCLVDPLFWPKSWFCTFLPGCLCCGSKGGACCCPKWVSLFEESGNMNRVQANPEKKYEEEIAKLKEQNAELRNDKRNG